MTRKEDKRQIRYKELKKGQKQVMDKVVALVAKLKAPEFWEVPESWETAAHLVIKEPHTDLEIKLAAHIWEVVQG